MLSSSTNKSNKGLSGKEISDNPGDRIEYFTNKLREVEKYLEPKSKLGAMLCHKFLEMLNDIVENMVSNLQRNIDELEANIALRL